MKLYKLVILTLSILLIGKSFAQTALQIEDETEAQQMAEKLTIVKNTSAIDGLMLLVKAQKLSKDSEDFLIDNIVANHKSKKFNHRFRDYLSDVSANNDVKITAIRALLKYDNKQTLAMVKKIPKNC